jgi:hypothetical protein
MLLKKLMSSKKNMKEKKYQDLTFGVGSLLRLIIGNFGRGEETGHMIGLVINKIIINGKLKGCHLNEANKSNQKLYKFC